MQVFRCLLVLDGLVETLHVDLTDTLRTTHHVGRIHGLVGRDHHELLHPVFHGVVSDDLRTPDIVQHSLRGVVLHHRHMLVGSSMEHVVRPERTEDLLHTALTADTRHHHLRLNVREVPRHHQTDIVLGRLGLVDEHHLGRFEGGHLAHHLRTDTTGRTSDQHTRTLQ